MTPSWLLDLLAVIMLTVAAVTATRILARWLLPELAWRPGQAATTVDLANVLMGISMAGMFTSSLATLPAVLWEVVFGLLTGWFGYRAWADTRGVRGIAADRCTLHVVHSAAMLYAFLALGTATSGGGLGGIGGGMGGVGGMGGISGVGGMGGLGGMGGVGGMGGSAAMPTLSHPTLAGAFVVLLVGYSVWDLNQLSGGRYRLAVASGAEASGAVASGAEASGAVGGGAVASGRDPVVRAFVLSPQTRVGSDVILGIGMALMLVIMI